MRATVNFYLTWKCNFTCAHCIHECGPQGEHMTTEQISYGMSFIRWLQEKNIEVAVIGTTGGEATLHPDFWTDYMPSLAALRHRYGWNMFELHTNASQPVPPERKTEYPKFFSTVIVGHDMCHRSFVPLNKLYLQDYTDIGNQLILRQNDYIVNGDHTIYVRAKGRAQESITNGKFEVLPVQGHPKMACVWHNPQQSPDCLHFVFTPDHLNHCGEKSHPLPPLPHGQGKIDEGQFYEYGIDFDTFLHSALDYTANHAGERCSQKCMSSFCRMAVKSPLKDLTVSLTSKENEQLSRTN